MNYRAGHTHQAIESLLNSLKRDPQSFITLYDLAIIYLTMGENKEAIKVLRRLLKVHPDHEAAYYHLGKAYNNLERHHEALYSLNKALELNPYDKRVRKMIDSISEFTQYPEGPI